MVAAEVGREQPRVSGSGSGVPWAELLVAAVAIALYAATVGYDLVFDDRSLLGPDGPVRLGNATLPYRPLRYVSYHLDYWIGGGAPWAYHAGNVVMHALASVLVLRLAWRLAQSRGVVVLAALGFAAHPLCVETVAYVAGRRDLLATVFGLAAILLWMSPRGRGALAILCVILAAAAKESGALYVGALALASAAGHGPPLRAAALSLTATSIVVVALPIAYGAIGPLAPSGGLCAALATPPSLASHYARQILLPLRLAVEYPALSHPSGACGRLVSTEVLAGLALLGGAAGFVAAAIFGRNGGREGAALRLAWGWVGLELLAIAAVVGVHEPGADRHAYPLLAMLAVALAVTAARARRGRPLVLVVGTAMVATLFALSARRIPLWTNELALWSATVSDVPESGRAQHNLAGALAAAGRFEEAATRIRRARLLGYRPALLGDAAIACARGRVHRGRDLLERARGQGFPAAQINPIAATCR